MTAYCVALPDGSVTGIELVELAGEQHGLDYSLGFGGEAVCRLEGVGPEGDDCFGEYPEFWGYWHGNGSGGWTWAGTGAGSASIEDGDVDGWSWGAGDNGSNHQAPPATDHSDVCVPVEEPPQTPGNGGNRPRSARATPAPAPAVAAPSAPPSGAPATERPHRPGQKPRARQVNGRPATPPVPTKMLPSPTPSALAAEPAGDERDGPPVTGLVGLAAAATLAALAWTGSRRARVTSTNAPR